MQTLCDKINGRLDQVEVKQDEILSKVARTDHTINGPPGEPTKGLAWRIEKAHERLDQLDHVKDGLVKIALIAMGSAAASTAAAVVSIMFNRPN